MALSSWNGVYNHVEQRFMRKRRYKLFFLLKCLCQHADEFGLCYPGDDLMQELSGLGTQAMLNEGLQFLVDGEYIKVWESWNPRRRAWDRDFQLSPAVLYIREELMPYAIKVWESGERDFGYENAIVIKRNGQPESEPESETRINNQNHHPSPPPRQHSSEGADGDGAHGYTNQPEGPQRKKRKPSTGKARASEKENPQAGGRPPAPDKIDLRKYQGPLPHAEEDRAQDLSLMFRMKISQARGLVANYGVNLVATAAEAVQDAMKTTLVTNPPGLLTHYLKRGAVSPEDRKLYPTQAQKLADANAQMTYQDNEFDQKPDDQEV